MQRLLEEKTVHMAHGPAARYEGSLRLLHDCGQPRSNRREPSKQPTLGHENEHDALSDTESYVAAGSAGSGYLGQCGRRARTKVGDVGCAICDIFRSNGTKVGSSRSADLQVICPGLVWSWDGIDGAIQSPDDQVDVQSEVSEWRALWLSSRREMGDAWYGEG
jgi:hypothetical protein